MLSKSLVGFEPTYRGFADPETSTFNLFIWRTSAQIVHPFVRFWFWHELQWSLGVNYD